MAQTSKPPDDDGSVFIIGEPGLAVMAVCAPAAMTREQIAAELNAETTGIFGAWAVTDDPALLAACPDDTTTYPVPCPDACGRLHYMVISR